MCGFTQLCVLMSLVQQQTREHQPRIDEQKRQDEQNEAQRLADQRRVAHQQWEQQEYERKLQQQRQRQRPIQVQSAQNLSAINEWNAICQLPVDSGPCSEYQDAFYFDHFTKSCYAFIYSGCQGNKNNFKSRNECELRCGHVVPVTPSSGNY